MNPNDSRELIKQEYLRCKEDVVYFLKKYCYIQHPIKGREKFNLYPFQEKLARIAVMREHKNIIINKSRQMGISTLMSGICVWEILFHADVNILVIATKQSVAVNLITKVKYMYDNLPNWLTNDSQRAAGKKGSNVKDYNKQSIKLRNNSQIKAVAASPDAGRSEAVTLLIIDEAAHIEGIDEIYTSIKPTLALGGRCVALSSPLGMNNFFHRTFMGAVNQKNNFLPIELPWHHHPERDQAWFDRESADMSEQEIAQEYNCDFLASGNTVVDPKYLKKAQEMFVQPPVEMRGVGRDFWIWEYPKQGHHYIIACDVSRGDSVDYSTMQIIDTTTCEQVAEFQSKINPTDFAREIIMAGYMYNNALVVIENNGLSLAVVEPVVNSNYPNLYYTTRGGIEMFYNEFTAKYMNSDKVPGFTMSARIRPLVVSKLQEYFRTNSIIIRSSRTMHELYSFIWHNNKAQATAGEHDDLVIPLGTALFVRDTHAEFMQTYDESTRIMLGNMQKNGTADVYMNNYANRQGYNNPFAMHVGNNEIEDIRWVLGR